MADLTTEQLLNRFNFSHLGTAHGIANVLCLIADKCIDPATWDDPYPCEMIRRETLINLAKKLTADLPQPYGRTPEQTGLIPKPQFPSPRIIREDFLP